MILAKQIYNIREKNAVAIFRQVNPTRAEQVWNVIADGWVFKDNMPLLAAYRPRVFAHGQSKPVCSYLIMEGFVFHSGQYL